MTLKSVVFLFIVTVTSAGVGLADELDDLKARAAKGDAKAQVSLGTMYATGQGVPQDYGEAVKWLRLAATQGLAAAQFNLGFMSYWGRGVLQDYAEAVK